MMLPLFFMWFDRFAHRVFPLSLIGLFIALYNPGFGEEVGWTIMLLAGLWAISDLARREDTTIYLK